MDTAEGTVIVRAVVKWFSGLAKGGRQLEPYGGSGRKHKLSYEKSGITIVRRPCEGGGQWNRWWKVRIETKNTTQDRTQSTTQLIPESAISPYHKFLRGYQ